MGNEGVSGNAAADILQELQDGKWVDDARYAGCYAREKAAIAGWGAVKIRYHLRAKGIAPEAVKRALEELDDAEASRRMKDVLKLKWSEICRREKDERKRKMKMVRFALGRGYSSEDAFSVMNNYDCNI